MKLDRNTFEWGSVYGRIKVVDMEDSHVLNLVGFLKEREEMGIISALRQEPLIRLFDEEVKIRGLSFFYTLKRLELMPWQCAHTTPDGDKKRWDWKKGMVKV